MEGVQVLQGVLGWHGVGFPVHDSPGLRLHHHWLRLHAGCTRLGCCHDARSGVRHGHPGNNPLPVPEEAYRNRAFRTLLAWDSGLVPDSVFGECMGPWQSIHL